MQESINRPKHIDILSTGNVRALIDRNTRMLQSTTNTAAITSEIKRYTEWQVVAEKTHKKEK
ncbi:MAG: hypothetical protein L3J75_04575 [Methylococcaceae bacterium]|nr:hypothetical protein [Methylococcaceae bacterium]